MTATNYSLYCTYDRASEFYSFPFPAENDNVALRGFIDLLSGNGMDRATNHSLHPDDFDLFILGHFDAVTGRLSVLESPLLVEQGKQIAIKFGLPKQRELPLSDSQFEAIMKALDSYVPKPVASPSVSDWHKPVPVNDDSSRSLVSRIFK